MEMKRLAGDPAEARAFSWDALLAGAPNATAPRRPRAGRRGWLLLAGALPLLGFAIPFLAAPAQPAFPSDTQLLLADPEVDLTLLRLHESLLEREDAASLELRLRCDHWLRERARL